MTDSAWILRAISELNDRGSWTGRTHVHKLLYLAQELLKADVPFPFEFYQFGPYSFDVDAAIRNLEAVGWVEKEYPDDDSPYGAKHRLSAEASAAGPGALELPQPDADKLHRAAKAVGDRTSSELELIATCLWVERREGITRDEAIVSRVAKLKPRYSREKIESALASFRKVEQLIVG